jgi:hypothetical protein
MHDTSDVSDSNGNEGGDETVAARRTQATARAGVARSAEDKERAKLEGDAARERATADLRRAHAVVAREEAVKDLADHARQTEADHAEADAADAAARAASTEAALAALDRSGSTKAKIERLDSVARILVTAVTLLAAALAAYGVTGDRAPQLLDEDVTQQWLLLSGAAVVVCIAAGLGALAVSSVLEESILLLLGTVALVASLAFGIGAAAVGFSGNGRPTFTDVSMTGTRSELTLAFTVRADGVDRDDYIQVLARGLNIVATNAGRDSEQCLQEPVLVSTLRPDDKGVIQQKLVMAAHFPATACLGAGQRLTPITHVDLLALRHNVPARSLTPWQAITRLWPGAAGDDPGDGHQETALADLVTKPFDCADEDQTEAPGCVTLTLPPAS